MYATIPLVVARLQNAEKNAGYRQWTTEDWKDLGGRITQGWILEGKGLEKTVTSQVKSS